MKRVFIILAMLVFTAAGASWADSVEAPKSEKSKRDEIAIQIFAALVSRAQIAGGEVNVNSLDMEQVVRVSLFCADEFVKRLDSNPPKK